MNYKNRIIKLLGGWTDDEVLKSAVKELYNTIGSDDILQEESGKWLVEGKPLNDAERKLLIAEATQFLNTKLWRVLQIDIKYKANKVLYEKAQSEIDLITGKLWLYTLDTIKTRLESISKDSGRFNNRVPSQ